MIPGDFQTLKPTRRQLIKHGILGVITLGVLVVAAVALTFVISAWLGRPVVFATEGPDQPIAFPHPTHVEDLGMDCTFCHRNVTEGAAATIPSAGLCMTCHEVVGDGLEEIEKLREMHEDGRPIDWVRVHRVPDHVHFVHEAHIQVLLGARRRGGDGGVRDMPRRRGFDGEGGAGARLEDGRLRELPQGQWRAYGLYGLSLLRTN